MKTYKVISSILFVAIFAGCSSSSGSDSSDPGGNGGNGSGSGDGGVSGGDGGPIGSGDGGGVVDTLTASTTSSLIMAPGGTGTLTVTITRGGWDGDVTLAAKGLPSGITADAATIAKGATSADVTFHSTAAASASAAAAAITASGNALTADATFAISIGHESVDSSFGTGGVVFFDPNTYVYDFVTQADGKIVASLLAQTGHDYQSAAALMRFDDAGKVDTTFGTTGQTLFPAGTGFSPSGLAQQNDGKLLVGFGASSSSAGTPRMTVVRTSADGTVDTSFGSSGLATLDFGTCTGINAGEIAVQSDGKILVGAALQCTDGTTAFAEGAVARFTSSGAVDSTFGASGKLLLPATTTSSTGIGHLVATSDALYVLGTHYYNKPGQGFVTEGSIFKYDSNGLNLDTTFATSGSFTRPATFSNQTTTLSCLIPETGKGLLWGQDGGGLFGRLTTAGALDATFGDASGGAPGIIGLTETFDGDWDDDSFTDLALGAGNTLFLAQSNIPKKSVELWAYSADGTRNLAFGGSSGRIIVSIGYDPAVRRVRVGTDGRVVVLSSNLSGGGTPAAALLRFFP